LDPSGSQQQLPIIIVEEEVEEEPVHQDHERCVDKGRTARRMFLWGPPKENWGGPNSPHPPPHRMAVQIILYHIGTSCSDN